MHVHDRSASKLPRLLVREGGRNRYLARHAGSLVRKGLDEAAIRGELEQLNRADCAPPLGEKEVAQIARSLAKRGRPKR